MNRKNIIIDIVLIAFLIISGIFSQFTLLTPTMQVSDESSPLSRDDASKIPETSDVSGTYDWGDGNTMDIDAAGSVTNTTFHNASGSNLEIYSKKEDNSVTTFLNNTLNITSNQALTSLEDKNYGKSEIYHDIEKHNYVNTPVGGNAKLNFTAEGNFTEKRLDTFGLEMTFPSEVVLLDYEYQRAFPEYALNLRADVNFGGLIGLQRPVNTWFDYNNNTNTFKWKDETLNNRLSTFPSYVINESGVWEEGTPGQVIDWDDPNPQSHYYFIINTTFAPWAPGEFMIRQTNITKANNSIIINYKFYMYVPAFMTFPEINDTVEYEMVLTKRSDKTIEMSFVMLKEVFPFSFNWYRNILTYSVDNAPYNAIGTCYLWNIVNVLYTVFWEYVVFKIQFYWTWVTIQAGGIGISIWGDQFLLNHWFIGFAWADWAIEIVYWRDEGIFMDYLIEIQYKTWYYVYRVPTLILPNFLTIAIIKTVYTDLWFYITVKVTDFLGQNISGATITGTWDGGPIGTVDDNGDGTYNFTLPAKFITSGGIPLWLNLTASKSGYDNGGLNTEIALEFTRQLKINIVESRYSDDSFNFTVEVTNCSGFLVDPDEFFGEWDGIALLNPDNITDNGDGTFDLKLTPLYVPKGWGGSGRILNLTAKKAGYVNATLIKEIFVETNTSTRPILLLDSLGVDLVEQVFSDTIFVITLYVYNVSNNQGVIIDYFNTDIFWGGDDVHLDIKNMGGGYYNISLTPITVAPGEDPIILNGTISASGFDLKDFEFLIGVDPAVIDKGPLPPPSDGNGGDRKLAKPPDYTIPMVIGVIAIIAAIGITLFFIRKKRLTPE